MEWGKEGGNLHLHWGFLTITVTSQGLVETIVMSRKEKFPGCFSFQQEAKEALSSRRLGELQCWFLEQREQGVLLKGIPSPPEPRRWKNKDTRKP